MKFLARSPLKSRYTWLFILKMSSAAAATNLQPEPSLTNGWRTNGSTGYFLDYQKAKQPGNQFDTTVVESFNQHNLFARGRLGYELSLFELTSYFEYSAMMTFRGDRSQFSEGSNDPFDESSPFHLKNTERHHRFRAKGSQKLTETIEVGADSFYQVNRLGSSVFPGTAEQSRPAMTSSETSLIAPKVAATFYPSNHQTYTTQLLLVFNKHVSYEAKEMSFQSYKNLEHQSFALEQILEYPHLRSKFLGRYYAHHHIFNFSAKDYQRSGILVQAFHRYQDFKLWAMFTSFVDSYDRPLPTTSSCASVEQQNESFETVTCTRRDKGSAYQISLSYQISPSQQGTFRFENQKLFNPRFQQFETEDSHFIFQYEFSPDLSFFDTIDTELERFETFGFDARVDTSL